MKRNFIILIFAVLIAFITQKKLNNIKLSHTSKTINSGIKQVAQFKQEGTLKTQLLKYHQNTPTPPKTYSYKVYLTKKVKKRWITFLNSKQTKINSFDLFPIYNETIDYVKEAISLCSKYKPHKSWIQRFNEFKQNNNLGALKFSSDKFHKALQYVWQYRKFECEKSAFKELEIIDKKINSVLKSESTLIDKYSKTLTSNKKNNIVEIKAYYNSITAIKKNDYFKVQKPKIDTNNILYKIVEYLKAEIEFKKSFNLPYTLKQVSAI